MFNKILIANRGEIACRIIKTARSMGIHCVAIYSSVDKDNLHVKLADSAYCVGDAPAKDSYLNIDNIIKAALASGVQAIHPGYGFLSENPKFARACAKAGIVFIGPSVEAMEAMASKQLAKQSLEGSNVPLTPGYHGSDQSEDTLLRESKKIGFPVLIKAANGGGGKGMRAVYSEAEFSSSLAGAKRESTAGFADDTMIIEKLVTNPRHVELQIMADNHGNIVHLFERDCSIQRRHQKIIEEAPAPLLSDDLRQNLADAACEVARSINYRGAGTVEFLVSGDSFYFMEMNTRLQVEHPVTEMITGLDLVEWQLKIAANEPLPLAQKEIKSFGHALECRIYAEDPYNGFIPSIGEIQFLEQPSGEGIRVDTGVSLGSHITMYYDPMIAKLIVFGNTRAQALQRLQQALTQYYIGGVKSNIPFLKSICHHPKFMNVELSTDFLSNETIDLPLVDIQQAMLFAVSYDYCQLIKTLEDPLLVDSFAWQMNVLGHWTWRYIVDNKTIEAVISPINHSEFKIRLQELECLISTQLVGNKLSITLDQQTITTVIESRNSKLTLYLDEGQITLERFTWNNLNLQSTGHKGQLTAPMPSTVVAILKNIGETVKAGDRLVVLEAMKMEHTIHAPKDGILQDIFYAVGSQVNEGAELLSLGEVSA